MRGTAFCGADTLMIGGDWVSRTDRDSDGSDRFGRSADGNAATARKTFGMHQGSGFLTTRQRRLAWLGFLLAAAQAPVSARFTEDSSWLFSVVVALMVATVIIADDTARRRPADARPTE
ncbi:hypothetical protein [Micromonospora sp. NPDC003241]